MLLEAYSVPGGKGWKRAKGGAGKWVNVPDEVGNGDKVFDAAIVFTGLEAIENARKMLGNCPAEALEGFESVATGPTQPALEEGLRLIRRCGLGIDRSQRFLDAPGAGGLEIRALQPVHGLGLLDGPVGGFLLQAPAGALEFGFTFDLGPAHLVQRLAAQSDHVKAVEADLGLGKVLGGAP